MGSGPLSWFLFGLITNATSGQYFDSSSTTCFTANNTPGTCTPLYQCRAALRDLARLRSSDYCSKYSIIPSVCCPTVNNDHSLRPIAPPPATTELNPTQTTQYPLPPEKTPTTTTQAPQIDARDGGSGGPDSITYYRLADRKCIEYSDFIYETLSFFDSTTNETIIEKVSNCEVRFGPAVVGGQKASAGEYPHMALIGYSSGSDGNPQWLCGGAIISLKYILTAAHCIQTTRGSPSHVRVGDLNHESTADDAAPQQIPVARSIAHEQYRNPYVYNDIGLLQLMRNIKVTEYARPACLYTEHNLLSTIPVIATGWGRTDVVGPTSKDLLEVTLEQFSTGQCRKVYAPSRQLPSGVSGDSQICAGSMHEKKDTCKGDSGGPLQVKHETAPCMFSIVGVTSFGKGCGIVGVPGVYTRVSNYIDWIEERAFSGE